jgi:hypothetical protein
VIASHWAHRILYHQVDVAALKLPLGVFMAALVVIFLGPYLLYSAPLRQLKRRSLLAYGALVGEHGWLVQRRWILGEPVEDTGLLEAPELGPVGDTITMYEAVKRIKPVPLGKQALQPEPSAVAGKPYDRWAPRSTHPAPRAAM